MGFSDDDDDSYGAITLTNNKTLILMERCKKYQRTIRSLQAALKVATSRERQMKRQIRIDYQWDGDDANFADTVSNWVKTYLFPRYKFLKDGWINYSDDPQSLSSFVKRKVQLAEGADFQEQWERVICPTIQMKYVSIRCNMNSKIRKAYMGKL